MNIAICIIAYNRLASLKNVLESISKAYYDQEVTLIISIDKSENKSIVEYANQYEWKYGHKQIISHSRNLGLRQHVLKCGDLVAHYDGLIVLEDDITVAESFFFYARQCVEEYKENDDIAGISLYNFQVNYQNCLPFYPLRSDSDVFLMQCAQSWGQVWMPRQWTMFRKWYDKHCDEFVEEPHLPQAICSWPKSSWLKYHTRYCIEQRKYFIYPYISLSTNNGDAGAHVVQKSTLFQSCLLYGMKKYFYLNPVVKYDGFFENELLYNLLGLKEDELCLDFYGSRQNRTQCRYWLTRKHLPYKIMKSFALERSPYEINVYAEISGRELFLYDTTIRAKNKFKKTECQFLCYIYHFEFSRKFVKNIIKLTMWWFKSKIFTKI